MLVIITIQTNFYSYVSSITTTVDIFLRKFCHKNYNWLRLLKISFSE